MVKKSTPVNNLATNKLIFPIIAIVGIVAIVAIVGFLYNENTISQDSLGEDDIESIDVMDEQGNIVGEAFRFRTSLNKNKVTKSKAIVPKVKVPNLVQTRVLDLKYDSRDKHVGEECLRDAQCYLGVCINRECQGTWIPRNRECIEDRQCQTNLVCVYKEFGGALSGRCLPANNRNIGEDCIENTQCTSNFCLADDPLSNALKHCAVPNVQVGQRCAADEQCQSGFCPISICQIRGATQLSGRCSHDQMCVAGLRCLNDDSVVGSPSTCVEVQLDQNDECVNRFQCESRTGRGAGSCEEDRSGVRRCVR